MCEWRCFLVSQWRCARISVAMCRCSSGGVSYQALLSWSRSREVSCIHNERLLASPRLSTCTLRPAATLVLSAIHIWYSSAVAITPEGIRATTAMTPHPPTLHVATQRNSLFSAAARRMYLLPHWVAMPRGGTAKRAAPLTWDNDTRMAFHACSGGISAACCMVNCMRRQEP